jgi:SSS family solute:Na+ symporter
MFPSWFVGIAFAAIAIGALVPAAIMSIACANLFTRNIYREYLAPDCSPAREAQVAKIVSLVVKLGALFFILELPTAYAIQFQLLGGILIIQTAPAVLLGLYTNKFNPWALLLGWIAGMASGTWMAWVNAFKVSIYPLHILGVIVPCYAAVSSLVINLAVSLAFSWLFNAVLRTPPSDATEEADYA